MSVNQGKVVIIGTSNVGSAVLNKIADFQLASEIALIDLNMDLARGEALDTSHAMSSPYSTNIKIHPGTYEDCRDAAFIVITAGPSILPGETPDRLKLASTNTKIMRSIFGEIVKYTKEAMIIMITNPLDVATYVVSTEFDYPRAKILGTGTMLETYRFRYILARHYDMDPKNIHGYVLGEHGNDAFVAWSTVNCAGLGIEHLDEYFHYTERLDRKAVEQELIQTAYDVINLKGFTNTGIAMVACRFIKAILYNEHTILPCSAVLDGEYGMRGVALSIPRMISRDGIVRSFEVRLPKDEMEKLQGAERSVRSALDGAGVQ
nr:L-lactate dehydrogenase [uncultured Selenomonas sp.]